MLNLYVVICAGSFSHHAVDMPSLCEYYDLYGFNTATSSIWFARKVKDVVKRCTKYPSYLGSNVGRSSGLIHLWLYPAPSDEAKAQEVEKDQKILIFFPKFKK